MWNPHTNAPCRNIFCKNFENWPRNWNFCSPYKNSVTSQKKEKRFLGPFRKDTKKSYFIQIFKPGKNIMSLLNIQILPPISTDWHRIFFLGFSNFFIKILRIVDTSGLWNIIHSYREINQDILWRFLIEYFWVFVAYKWCFQNNSSNLWKFSKCMDNKNSGYRLSLALTT